MSVITCDHGRRVHRSIKLATAPAWITFPDISQVIQVHRHRTGATTSSHENP